MHNELFNSKFSKAKIMKPCLKLFVAPHNITNAFT